MRRGPKVFVGAMLCVLLLSVASVAYAVPADARVVSTKTTTVSGVEMASQVLRNLDKVALGSQGATVTLDVDGAPRDIGIGLGDLVPAGPSGAGGLGGIAIIAAVAAAIFRGAAVLVRLVG